jgi:hypothetical protein
MIFDELPNKNEIVWILNHYQSISKLKNISFIFFYVFVFIYSAEFFVYDYLQRDKKMRIKKKEKKESSQYVTLLLI